MPRLPDRFDLWVRKARECPEPARQADYVLGALAGLKEWFFLNVGTKENPQPAEAETEGGRHLLVFSDQDRIEEIVGENVPGGEPLPIIAIPTAAAMVWCIKRGADGCGGLLVNPGEFAVIIPLSQLATFHAEWSRRSTPQATGFWIPNLTTEEEDFWQEHGI